MLKNLKKNHKFLIILVLFTTGLLSCYEDKEACLDIYGTNYDVTADKACDDCCSYPNISITFSHLIDTSDLSIDTIESVKLNVNTLYQNNLEQQYAIVSSKFFIRDIHLITISDQEIGSSDQISIPIVSSNEDIIIEDNINLVELNSSKITIKNATPLEDIRGIKFNIGLGEISYNIDTTQLEEDEILSNSISNMYHPITNNYVTGNIIYTRTIDSTAQQYQLLIEAFSVVTLLFEEVQTLSLGSDNNFTLGINYDKLFFDFDFDNATSSQLSQKWTENIVQSIEITSIN